VRGQMYIIRVVEQVNRGQGIKGNSSPLAPQVPLNAQKPKASTPKVLVAHPGLPARKAKKYATSSAKAFGGTEIGDSDGDDEDWESPRPKQPTREEESTNDADYQDSGSEFDLDETSSGANPKMYSSLFGNLVIGDSDGDDEDWESPRIQQPTREEESTNDADDQDSGSEFDLDETSSGANPKMYSSLLGNLVIGDDEEEEAGGEQPQNLADGHTSRHRLGGLVNGDGDGGGMDTRQSHSHVPKKWH